MKLAIFGATGQTGKLLVEQALAAEHTVIGFARNPSKLTANHKLLTVIQGDITNPVAVERAIQGVDAVISALNTQRQAAKQPLTHGTRNILAAMNKYGVRRLVLSSSAPSASDPKDVPDLRFQILTEMVKRIVLSAYEDIAGSVQAVQSCDLDWTIVRMPLPMGVSLK